MKNATICTGAASIALAMGMGLAGAPLAAADVTTTTFGNEARLVDGAVTQGWTVTGLKPSSDAIPYPVRGTLWEATATDTAISGGVTPIVSNFNARARNGDTYRVLFTVATPQGVNPSGLAQGQQATGKLYFDVTGANPDSVVYNAAGTDLLLWLTPPPAPSTGGAGTSGSTRGSASTATPAAPGAAAAGAPATAPGVAPGQPAAAETLPGTPAGSSGTPLPAGSSGTPLPAGSQGAPVDGAAPAGSTPTPQAVPPAATGSQGTPVEPAATPTPAPPTAPSPAPSTTVPPAAATAPAAAMPAGSQGTPVAPSTTAVAPLPQ